ncbi:hypothetical protein Salat_1415000 [Sesamum alatum]|uniref:Uncharacterized protein n=1 Tax=Sesamum alatum TaxID=300844 RepID=A0AAE1YAI9_9LAMI|nr:hypothetical protein Salat_1415000 [Sesamum alatum]
MKEAGLVDHEFNAKAILQEELLIVAGLHPTPDRYEGPLDRVTRFRIMMNRAAVRKFIPDDVPETPVIEVVTSPEDVPSAPLHVDAQQDVGSPLPPPVEDLPSSHKRPCVSVEGAEEVTPRLVPSQPAFPALVLTLRMDPQARAFNMSKAINRADVEVLTPRTFTGIGNLVLSHASIPAAITAMVEKYSYTLKNCEMLRRELQEAKAYVQGRCAEIETLSQERESKLKEELEALKNQMVEKDSQITMMMMENAAIRASTMQAYAWGREEGVSSAVTSFMESVEYADAMYCQASAYYVDGFATCLA